MGGCFAPPSLGRADSNAMMSVRSFFQGCLVPHVREQSSDLLAVVFYDLIHRIVDLAKYIYLMDILLVLAASLALYGKLRSTNDVYKMSREIITVGAFAFLAFGK